MKKVKLMAAGAFILLGSVLMPLQSQASVCIQCSDNDGKCRGDLCTDEKAWYESWDCIQGASPWTECD